MYLGLSGSAGLVGQLEGLQVQGLLDLRGTLPSSGCRPYTRRARYSLKLPQAASFCSMRAWPRPLAFIEF